MEHEHSLWRIQRKLTYKSFRLWKYAFTGVKCNERITKSNNQQKRTNVEQRRRHNSTKVGIQKKGAGYNRRNVRLALNQLHRYSAYVPGGPRNYFLRLITASENKLPGVINGRWHTQHRPVQKFSSAREQLCAWPEGSVHSLTWHPKSKPKRRGYETSISINHVDQMSLTAWLHKYTDQS
jgi:hypothetical protein